MSAKKISTIKDLTTLVNSLDNNVLNSKCLISMVEPTLLSSIQSHFKEQLNSSKNVRNDTITLKSVGSVFGFCSPNYFCETFLPTKANVVSFLESIKN